MLPPALRRHKVLLFIPNLQQGGAERQILELLTRLPARFEPTLCTYEDVVHYRETLPAGEPRHVLGVRRMGRVGLRRLCDVLRAERPAILHSYRDKANLWARLAAGRVPVPVVLTSVRNRWMAPQHLLSEWYLARRSDRVLTNSEGVRRELVGRARVPDAKIQIIHNFLDLERFRPPSDEERRAARARLGLGADELALVLPGRIGLQKNQVGLAYALRLLHESGRLPARLRLLLAGRPRDRLLGALLPRWLAWLGLAERTTFLGTVPEAGMIGLYHAADVLVMPSLYEGLPNAVLEAQACGLPAVVSGAANVDRIVTPGRSGWEAPTWEPAALAEALAAALATAPAALRRMGALGRDDVAARFAPARVLAETVALYDGLLSEKGLA